METASSRLYGNYLAVSRASYPRRLEASTWYVCMYEACPESKDAKVLNMYNIFNLQSDTVNELPVHNFIFQHSHRHCPNIY